MASKKRLRADPRRIKTSARFLLRSLSLRHTSFLLALLAVTVAATLTAALLGLKADLHKKMSGELKGYGPNLLILPAPGTNPAALEESSLLELPAVLRKAGIENSVGPSGMLLAAGALRSSKAGAEWAAATLVGVDFDSLPQLNPAWKLEGAWPARGAIGCVAGGSLAERLGVPSGATLEVRLDRESFPCPLTGLLSTGESEEEEVFVPLALLQERAGMAGRLSLAALSVEAGANELTRASRGVEKAIPGAQARVVWQVAAAQGALLGKLDRLAISLSVAVFLLCGLTVMTTLLSLVLEREPEIGLMRSLGAGDGEILLIFAGEVTLLGLVGATLGIVLGMGAARLVGHHLFGTETVPRLVVVPPVVAVSLGICWISVLLPLRRALTIQPAEALRGN